ncbi:MAG: desulfoferrodoxin family protein [Mycoplasma sp.]
MLKFLKLKNGEVIVDSELTNSQEVLEELSIKTEDVGFEKHLPYVFIENHKVCSRTGKDIFHPHTAEHHMVWFKLVIDGKVVETIGLDGTKEPSVVFNTEIVDGQNIDVYAYCNLHGVWKGTL